MRTLRRITNLFWLSLIALVIPDKAKPANLSEIDQRITKVRNNIKEELKTKDAKDISVNFEDFTSNSEWVNWGNWGNWNNWNNWAKWNDWRNWNNWGNWNDWVNY